MSVHQAVIDYWLTLTYVADSFDILYTFSI